jgi:anthraniloyl-CoA monooxygenase
VRDPEFVAKVDAWFAQKASEQSGVELSTILGRPAAPVPPPAGTAAVSHTPIAVASVPARAGAAPMFTPFKLRGLRARNRVVVSPMSQYSAVDGMPNDWHFQHLAARAVVGRASCSPR